MSRFTDTFAQSLRDHFYPGQTTIEDFVGPPPASPAGGLAADSHSPVAASKSSAVPDRKSLIAAVKKTRDESVAARTAYVKAVWAAHHAGVHNTRIASAASITEAGIRQLLKRTAPPS